MRDPKRIPDVMEKFQKLWEKYPDMRLGQMMEYIHANAQTHTEDPFYIEDDVWERTIDKLAGK